VKSEIKITELTISKTHFRKPFLKEKEIFLVHVFPLFSYLETGKYMIHFANIITILCCYWINKIRNLNLYFL